MGKLEQIEQRVKKRILQLEKGSEVFSKYRQVIEQEIHSTYLDNLEELSISLQPPIRFLDSIENKKYAKLRTILLSIFALVESKTDYLIIIKLNKNFPGPGILGHNRNVDKAISYILNKLTYGNKIELLKIIYNNLGSDADFLRKLGQIRDAFAHSLFSSSHKYNYGKRNVVENLRAFDDLIDKVLEVCRKICRIIEEQPEQQELHRQLEEWDKNKDRAEGG